MVAKVKFWLLESSRLIAKAALIGSVTPSNVMCPVFLFLTIEVC